MGLIHTLQSCESSEETLRELDGDNMSLGFTIKTCTHKSTCHKTNTPTCDKIRVNRTV